MGLYTRFCYDIGVKQVGLPRKGALLMVTTGRNMLGGLNTLIPQEWTQPARAYRATIRAPAVVRLPKIKKSLEERKAIREKKIMETEKASLHHVQTALRKYNRTNSTMVHYCYLRLSLLFRNSYLEFGY